MKGEGLVRSTSERRGEGLMHGISWPVGVTMTAVRSGLSVSTLRTMESM